MSEPVVDDPRPTPANKAWPIAFGVAAILLVIVVVLLILRWNGSDETSTVGTSGTTSRTGTTASGSTSTMSRTTAGPTSTRSTTASTPTSTTSTTRDASPSSSISEPVNLECSPSILLGVIDPNLRAADAAVTEYGCTPSTAGDPIDAYAWARLTAPNVNDIVVLYSGYVGTEPATPMPVEWTVLTYGSAVSCQKFIPAASCDMLPGVPR